MSKILVGYFSRGKISGIDHYLLNFMTKIDNSEHEVDFLTRFSDASVKKMMQEKGYGLHQIPRNRHFLRQFFAVRKLIKQNRYDIAYFNISESYNCIGLIAAKLSGVNKIIVHSHSSDSDGNFIVKNLKRFLNLLCKPILHLTADQFLACSDKAAHWLLPKRIFDTKSYSLIPNVIDFSRFAYSKTKSATIRRDILKTNHLPTDALILGFVGRFEYAKNTLFLVDILVEVLKKRNAYLICVGEHSRLFQKFKQYAKQRGVSDHIITPGISANISDFYQTFDVLLLPSRFEGLPVVAIEAQAAGLPCLLSNHIDEAVKIGAKTTLLPIKSTATWAKKILTLDLSEPHSNTLLSVAESYNLATSTGHELIFSLKPSAYVKKSYDLAVYLFFILHYLLNLTNVLNGLHLFLFPGALCIFLVFIHRINHRLASKPLLKDPLCRFLSLFFVSYIITALFTTHYATLSLIKIGVWTAFYIFFAFSYKLHQTEKNINYEVKQFFTYVVSVLSVINFVNLILLIAGVGKTILTPFGDKVLVGYASWGRFYGIFYDPNYASIVCACAIISSIHLLRQSKNFLIKLLLVFANILQLTYMFAGQSRTGFIALGVGLLCYILISLFNKSLKTLPKKRLLSGIIFSIVTILCSFGLTKLPALIHSSDHTPASTSQSSDESKTKTNLKLQRTDNRSDISNRRFDIWKSGFEIFSHANPIIGVGYSNIVSFAKDRLPETYIVNNSFQDFDAFHNTFVDLLVSQGLLGIAIVIVIVIYLAYLAIKNREIFVKYASVAPLFSALLAICASSMFVSEIFYINNCGTFIFWVLLGYYYYFLQTNHQKRKHLK